MMSPKREMKPTHLKKPKIQNLAKGGIVMRHYDSGGTVLSGPTTNAPAVAPNTKAGGLFGGISGLLGTQNNFQAGYAPVQAGTTAGQLNNSYGQANQAIGQNQALVNTLQPGAAQAAQTQNALTGQLQGVVAGTGPNAAQTALNQNTGQNIAQTAALQAGQRGGSQNVGLLARQIGQQGAATQQQAVGQAATQQAQQQLAAQQQLQSLAAQQAGQAQTAVGGLNTSVQGEQGILQNANTNLNNANVAMQSNANIVNSGVATANQGAANTILNDTLNAAGITSTAAGTPPGPPAAATGAGPSGVPLANAAPQAAYKGGKIAEGPYRSHVANFLHDGGEERAKAMVSPGERILSPEEVHKVIKEGANPLKLGRVVPGKAKVKGDSLKNDVIEDDPIVGSVVIPRHLTKPKHAEKAELFVHRAVGQKHRQKDQ